MISPMVHRALPRLKKKVYAYNTRKSTANECSLREQRSRFAGLCDEARIGRDGAAVSEQLSPAWISASYAPGSASTIDSTASKGARSAPSRWCRPARNPGEL